VIKGSLRNPIAVLMASLGLLLLGAVSVQRIPVDLFPKLSVPVIIIGTSFPGASPLNVEQNVTVPIERAAAQAWNLAYITSSSRQGLSIVQAWFRWGSDVNAALADVQQQVQAVQDNLPEHARAPMIAKFDLSSLPVALVTAKGGGLDERALYDLAQNSIAPQLSALPGVAAATVSGGRVRQINVDLDPNLLRQRGLSLLDVERAVRRANVVLPAGSLRSGHLEYDVFSNSQLKNVAEIEDVVVKQEGAVPVRVRDVGRVQDTHREQNQIVHVDGERAVYLQVYKQPGAHTVKTVEELRTRLPRLIGLPPGIELAVAFDQSDYIKNALRTLRHEALFGGGLAILVVMLFLGSLSATLVVAVAIPLSVVATVCVLYLTGQTLNVFTLGGISLAVGRLVDDAIVVLENIHRHQGLGKAPLRAAYDGAREVAPPVLASTVTTVIVFVPVLFVTGISSFLFTPLGVAIAVAMGASYLVSLTVVPALARRVGVHGEWKYGPFARVGALLERLDEGYGHLVSRLLRRKRWVIGGVALACTASLALLPRIGTEFFPATDEGQFKVVLRAPIGTRVEETEKISARVEALVREVVPAHDLRRVLSSSGTRRTGLRAFLEANTGPHTATVLVELAPPAERQRTVEQYVAQVRARAARELPGIALLFDPRGTVREVVNFGYSAPIVVEERGYDLPTAAGLAQRTKDLLSSVRGLTDVASSLEDHYPTIQVDVDRERAALFGISEDEVARALLGTVTGNFSRAPFITDPTSGVNYDIITRVGEQFRDDLDDLREISLQNKGKPILLRSLATVRRSSGPLDLRRRDQQRSIEVTANLLAARDLGSASDSIERRLGELKVPPGFSVQLRGQSEEQRESYRSLWLSCALALCIVYMVMAAQFRSFAQPFVILFSVPLGMVGVLVALWATRTSFSSTSMMGMLMMVGIVVSNGILLVNYASEERLRGKSPEEAAERAARVRLRPILMTSLATVVGLIPMAIGGPGSETYAPLARAVIGGLSASTFLTLLLVPVLFVLVEKRFPTTAAGRDDVEAELAG
jgi:hydrophobe/amphiphile efflux-1 (HAE1) family protein